MRIKRICSVADLDTFELSEWCSLASSCSTRDWSWCTRSFSASIVSSLMGAISARDSEGRSMR